MKFTFITEQTGVYEIFMTCTHAQTMTVFVLHVSQMMLTAPLDTAGFDDIERMSHSKCLTHFLQLLFYMNVARRCLPVNVSAWHPMMLHSSISFACTCERIAA